LTERDIIMDKGRTNDSPDSISLLAPPSELATHQAITLPMKKEMDTLRPTSIPLPMKAGVN